MKTVQRFDSYDSLRRYELSTGKDISLAEIQTNAGWSIDGGTMVYAGDGYYASAFYLMQVSPDSTSPVTITLDLSSGVFEAADVSQIFVFTAMCYSAEQNLSINVKLHDTTDGVEEEAGNTRSLQSGLWGAVRSNLFTLTDEEASNYVTITISNHNSKEIKISTPNLVNDTIWGQNPVLNNITRYMPDFYFEYDKKQTDPIYPMSRYIDVLTDAIADSMFMYSEWFEYDAREVQAGFTKADNFTKSRLTNHVAVYDENVDWLAQFSGAKLRKQIYVSGTGIIADGDLEAFEQAQLSPAIYGIGAGTQSAIRTAVEFVLGGTKSVVISQRYNDDPWAMRISTVASETPNIDIRESVRCASAAPVNITNELEPGDVIDDVTLAEGDRVLLKNQSTGSQNGVYVVPASGAASRATDFDSSGEVTTGAMFIVDEGTANGDKAFELTTTGTITVGSTALTFAEFTGSPEVLAVAEPARPMGYSLTHTIVDSFTLTLGDPVFGVLGTAVL